MQYISVIFIYTRVKYYFNFQIRPIILHLENIFQSRFFPVTFFNAMFYFK